MRYWFAPILFLFGLSCCGCSASQRETTIKATLAAVNESRDAFVVFDRATQAAIVETARTYERGVEALAHYREKREPVVLGFTVAYRAIAIAATVNDDPSVASMVDAAKQVADAWKALKEGSYAP